MRVLALIMVGRVLEKASNLSQKSLRYQNIKRNKPWFDNECSKLIDQWKQAKLQWLQNPNEINRDNQKNLRRETSRIFRNKKREYLKGKINEMETNNKTKILDTRTEA
jgi:hypothetical protein